MKESRSTWRPRPILAGALRIVIMLVPIGVSLVVTAVLRRVVPAPHELSGKVVWVGGLLVIAVSTAMGVERLGRRLLPLVTLLKLSMLFPDRAPSRFAIARVAGSVRRLEARVAEAGSGEGPGDEAENAEMVLALSVALQSHDRRTRGHAERVRVYTDLLGEELQLPESDRYRLRWAALLHDIGKLTIAPGILNKPGALDDREWALMKQHPGEGARIAAPLMEWLGPWGAAIVEHHERFDGKGYPAGVGGAALSQAGRIVSVADAYDTMTAARSYKKPMAVWAARRELADCAGGQFDPEMVRAFLSISLPRLLWRTGPLSLLVQLPFLGQLQQVGLQSVSALTQGVTAATVAAGVTAMAVAGPVPASAHAREHHRGSVAAASAAAVASASPTPGPQSGAGGSHASPSPRPEPAPQPMPGPSTEPTGSATSSPSQATDRSSPTPSETSSPSPSPSTRPSVVPLPTPTPLPSVPALPTPTVPPLPTGSVLPPLPTVSLPGLPNRGLSRTDTETTEEASER